MSASADIPRRSFLGWTAAIAGCALLTRPAVAVPRVREALIGVDLGGKDRTGHLLVWQVSSPSPVKMTVTGVDMLGCEWQMTSLASEPIPIPAGVRIDDFSLWTKPPRWASQTFFPYDPRIPTDEEIDAICRESVAF